ncbi:MAG: hypothetical protein FWJ61_08935 [Limnochordales bacterium]
MQDAAFKEFRRRIFALYNRQAYAEALALLERRGGEFPGFEGDVLFWRACPARGRAAIIGFCRTTGRRGSSAR